MRLWLAAGAEHVGSTPTAEGGGGGLRARRLGGRDAAEGRSGKNAAVRAGLTPRRPTVARRRGSVSTGGETLSVIFGKIAVNPD